MERFLKFIKICYFTSNLFLDLRSLLSLHLFTIYTLKPFYFLTFWWVFNNRNFLKVDSSKDNTIDIEKLLSISVLQGIRPRTSHPRHPGPVYQHNCREGLELDTLRNIKHQRILNEKPRRFHGG